LIFSSKGMKRLQAKKKQITERPTRILIADNHAVLVEGLRVLLEAQPDMKVIGCATNTTEALELAAKLRAGVAILALNVPGMNGVELARPVRKLSPNTRILILAMHCRAESVYQAFRAGADGYVVKEASIVEVIEAVRRISTGKRYMSEAISDVLIGDIASNGQLARAPLDCLTEREREVLKLTVDGKSSAASASLLGLSPKTVESYRSRLMRKLELNDVTGLVKFAIRHGVVSVD
jgi:DNA-binding NarL/FixJ family response regulator